MKSIRSYLLTRLLGGAALVLAGAGIAVYLIVARSLESQFDRNLADRVLGFASILFQVEDEVSFEFSDQLMPEYEREELPAYFQLWFDDGRLIERSNSLGERDLRLPEPAGREPTFWSAPLPDGRSGRFVAQLIEIHHVYPEEGPDRPDAATVLVAIGRGREDLLAAERGVMLACVAVALTLLTLLGILAWISVKRGLEPANRVAAALDRIEVDRLPESLDAGELPRELLPVGSKTDALIGRVDSALERERRTTADIAHELRTPLSELLTVSEVALRNGLDVPEAKRALGTIRDVAWRMGRSVSTLLKLARLEMGSEAFEHERVDVGELVGDQLRLLSSFARERELVVENELDGGDAVVADPDVLSMIVSNLLSNALYYSPRAGVVRCRFEGVDGSWRLSVENEADDLEHADLGALTEPFWRKDRARADRNRSGLGLALSRALADRTGLQLEFELEQRTFRAVLSRHAGQGGSA